MSPRNFFLDVFSFTWTELAPRPKAGNDFVVGTFLNSTAGETQVAVIDEDAIMTYSPRNDAWSDNTALFEAPIVGVNGGINVQLSSDYFIITGGKVDRGTGYVDTNDFLRFDETGLSLDTVDAFETSRRYHVALAVDDASVRC